MSRSHYRWVIVAAGGLLGCVAIGAMFSLPVFLRPISRDTGWSITGVSSAMTFGFLAMALGSIIWGNLSDRFGPRLIVLIGSGVLATTLALASRATSLIEFQLIFGLVVGGATAAIFAPMMACVFHVVDFTVDPGVCTGSRYKFLGWYGTSGMEYDRTRQQNGSSNRGSTARSFNGKCGCGHTQTSLTSHTKV